MNFLSFFILLLTPLWPVVFDAGTQPSIRSLKTSVEVSRDGDEWVLDVSVQNTGRKSEIFKLWLSAKPGFKAEHWLIPGINYDGNPFGEGFPQGWEHNGKPWIYAYDRGSIPSCTISENEEQVFALFASDRDTASMVSSCSMEKQRDGSFRHLIYWPVTEAPLSYTDKKVLTERYDTYLTLEPGACFRVRAYACTGVPKWKNYGFAEVFPVAWKRLSHHTPSQRPMQEVLRLDKAFQDWCRRQSPDGWWYGSILDDQVFRAGYYASKRSDDGYTVADYAEHPELNRWWTDDVEQSRHLAPGQYVQGVGRALGFAGQGFQMARLSVEYGLRNNRPEDVDFGLKVFRSWIRERMLPCGLIHDVKPKEHYKVNASDLAYSITELSRLCMTLRKYGLDASEFEQVAARIVDVVLRGARADGNLGSLWNGDDGSVLGWGGDSGGYVLMGLVRWWQLTRDEKLLPVIDRAFDYYYRSDIDYFRCAGGAMDCASIDREGIHPFLTSAMVLYREREDEKYLEYARKAGWYFLSWLYIQNPVYGPETDFARFGIRPAGGTIVGVEHPALDEYACVLIPEFFALSRMDKNPMWRDVAVLIWSYSTQCFADEQHRIWHSLERPVGSKQEAIFPSRWSKYHVGERKRGSINDHLTAWGGTYRIASLYDLSVEDLLYLDAATRPVD